MNALLRGLVVSVVAMAMLSGCGFRLQGSGEVPESMQNIYVQANDRYSLFYRALTRRLQEQGATLATDPATADAVLYVLEESLGQRVSAVSIRNTPLEYEVFYTVNYSVTTGGKELLKPTRITAKNRYEYDDTKVLGKDAEKNMLANSQAEDIARQVLLQLSVL